MATKKSKTPHKNLPFRAREPADFPEEIQIQTQTRCQSRCVTCPYPQVSKEVSHGKMAADLFTKIIDECAQYRPKTLRPFAFNEPLIDRRIPAFVHAATRRLTSTRVVLTSNGVLLQGRVAEELVSSGLSCLWVNIPSINEQVYGALKVGPSLRKVINNTLAFQDLIHTRHVDLELRIAVLETAHNIGTVEESRRFWSAHGIPVDTAILNNRAANVDTEHLRVLREVVSKRTCDRPFYKMWILYNGDAVLCSSDWRRTTVVGNVGSATLHSVWHGDRMTELRRQLLSGGAPAIPLCRDCDYVNVYG